MMIWDQYELTPKQLEKKWQRIRRLGRILFAEDMYRQIGNREDLRFTTVPEQFPGKEPDIENSDK